MLLTGRTKLQTTKQEITASNILDVLNAIIPKMKANQGESDYLYKYYKGIQPIRNRVKTFRPEICNRAVENHAMEIVSFKVGYIFGEPIQYVCRASDEDQAEDTASKQVARLNEYMYCANKAASDKELAEWMFITGTGYRMILPDANPDTPFQIHTLDPRFTAVVYDSDYGEIPKMSIQEKVDEKGETIYNCYTPNHLYVIKGMDIISDKPHAMGYIPVIEYPANSNRIGAFEPVIDLLDALNVISNNRIDGLEQFVQSFIKAINVKIDEDKYEKLRQQGMLLFDSDAGNPADVDIIASELKQTETQVLVDNVYQMILTISDMPDRNGSNRTTGDTGQAVIIRDGWTAAESYARSVVTTFNKPENQFIKIALRILRDNSPDISLKISDVGIKFTRNMTDNMLTKTQALQNMLEAGVHPRIAFRYCNMFSDPEQAHLDSAADGYLDKWKNPQNSTITPANNKPNPVNE